MLGSDLTDLLMLCSDDEALVDTDDNKEDAGSFRDSDDSEEDLLSWFDELEEWRGWETCLEGSVLNNGFLSGNEISVTLVQVQIWHYRMRKRF